jgi:hypothetical protein
VAQPEAKVVAQPEAPVEMPITDCPMNDGILIATRQPHPLIAERKSYSTWQLMKHHGARMKVVFTAPPVGVPEATPQKGQLVASFASLPVDPNDDAMSEAISASSANADEVISGKTFIGSRASLRSSTRNTPSKQRRNLLRAIQHKKAKTEGGSADPDDDGSVSDEYESDEEKKVVVDHPASLGKRVMNNLDRVPETRRREFLEMFSSFIENFLMPPSQQEPPQTAGPPQEDVQEVTSPSPTTPVASPTSPVTSPSPTSPVPRTPPPRPPPPGVRGRGNWIDGVFVVDQDFSAAVRQNFQAAVPPAQPRPPPPVQQNFSVAISPMQELRARLTLWSGRACPLCQRLMTCEHETSKLHVRMMEEHIAIDAICGPVRGCRNMSPLCMRPFYSTAENPLTAQSFRAHWGEKLPLSMVHAAYTAIKERGISFGGGRARYTISSDSLEMGILEYSGQGHYPETTEWFAWPIVAGEEQVSEERKERLIDPSKGYWPVCKVKSPWDSEGSQVDAQTGGGCRTRYRTRCRIYVICVYQIMWPQPRAWEVWQAPSSRM